MRTGAAVLAFASVVLLGACGGGEGTPKNAVSFTDDRGNQVMMGATANVVSVSVVRF
jgi:hypothetical protein